MTSDDPPCALATNYVHLSYINYPFADPDWLASSRGNIDPNPGQSFILIVVELTPLVRGAATIPMEALAKPNPRIERVVHRGERLRWTMSTVHGPDGAFSTLSTSRTEF